MKIYSPLGKKLKRKNNIRWMILFGLGFFLIGIAILLSFPKSIENQPLSNGYSTIPIQVNFQAPNIMLTDLNSQIVSLGDRKGEIVLVNNWATWCPPCKAEMPTLEAFYREHMNEGFVIIAIESGESLEEVTEFVENFGITFPVWVDRDGIALEAFKNWNLPSSYVIDRSGTVRLTWTGEISLAMLEKYVTPLLIE
jgi:peroxiredoxin